MCQGCRDFMEFDAKVDAIIAAELPKMLAQPDESWILRGEQPPQAPAFWRKPS